MLTRAQRGLFRFDEDDDVSMMTPLVGSVQARPTTKNATPHSNGCLQALKAQLVSTHFNVLDSLREGDGEDEIHLSFSRLRLPEKANKARHS